MSASYAVLVHRLADLTNQNKPDSIREIWWRFGWERPVLRNAMNGLEKYIVTPEVSKHRIFSLLVSAVLPDDRLTAIATDDGKVLGTLSSTLHKAGELAVGGTLEDRPVYTKASCFEPFPFPAASPKLENRIRDLGERLDAHRKRQQSMHADLTMTGMHNVLEKLRVAGASCSQPQPAEKGKGQDAPATVFTAKERQIHDDGLVSVLKQIHDELDAAVRAEEKKNGKVRWLRPDFQNPQGDSKSEAEFSTQAELPGTATKKVAKQKASKAKPQPWPKSLPEQITAVRDLLAASATPLSNIDLLAASIDAHCRNIEGEWPKESSPEIVSPDATRGHADSGRVRKCLSANFRHRAS